MENTPCTYRISVKGIITDDTDRVLLLRESDGSWELPGGGLEQGESAKEALAREIAEEAKYFTRDEAKELKLHANTKPYFS